MASRLDQLTKINEIRNNEQVLLTWVKDFETKFREDLANARNVKNNNVEKTTDPRKAAEEAIVAYEESFREKAASIPRQEVER